PETSTDLGPGPPGISRAGGDKVIKASGCEARAEDANSFAFGSRPVWRYFGAAGRIDRGGLEGWNVIPDGCSGNLASPLYALQLGVAVMSELEVLRGARAMERFSVAQTHSPREIGAPSTTSQRRVAGPT